MQHAKRFPPLSVMCCCRQVLHLLLLFYVCMGQGNELWQSVFSSKKESFFPVIGETFFAVTKLFVSLISILL